jgi:hypothetical protein
LNGPFEQKTVRFVSVRLRRGTVGERGADLGGLGHAGPAGG